MQETVELTEADVEDLDRMIYEIRLSDEEALAHDPDFAAWLEKVAAGTDAI